jgi:uncharacterized protein DUF6236
MTTPRRPWARSTARSIRTGRAPAGIEQRPGTCLYYPYFSISNETWLKEALLWWDRIATIVPNDVPIEAIADDQMRALADFGVFEAWPVEARIRDRAAKTAIRLMDEGALADFPDAEDFELHFGKLTGQLQEQLYEREQVVRGGPGSIYVKGKTGLLVLSVLAHMLAEETRAWALTDDPQLATAYLGIARRSGAGAGVLSVIEADIDVVIPQIQDVPIARWLKFREEHPNELEVYRRSIANLARDVARAADTEEAEEILAERKDALRDELDRQKGIFNKLTSEVAVATISFVAAAGGFAVNPALGAAVSAVAAGAIVASQFRRREIHQLSFLAKAARLPKS